MGFLTRLLAGLVAASTLGAGLAGTAGAADSTGTNVDGGAAAAATVANTTNTLSDHLVNSDFEYLPDGGWKTVDAPSYMRNAYTSVDLGEKIGEETAASIRAMSDVLRVRVI